MEFSNWIFCNCSWFSRVKVYRKAVENYIYIIKETHLLKIYSASEPRSHYLVFFIILKPYSRFLRLWQSFNGEEGCEICSHMWTGRVTSKIVAKKFPHTQQSHSLLINLNTIGSIERCTGPPGNHENIISLVRSLKTYYDFDVLT
jgi:hypothetical protein